MNIGLIGPKMSMNKIEMVLEEVDTDCIFEIRTYDSLEDIIKIYNENHTSWDGILFSGELGFSFLESKIDKPSIPYKFILFDEKYFFGLLIKHLVDNPSQELSRIYIDFISASNSYYGLKQFLANRQMPQTPMFSKLSDLSYEEVFNDISTLWSQGKIDMVFTRITNNLSRLDEIGIPYKHVWPPDEIIVDSIKNAINEIEILSIKKQQLAVSIIEIPNSFESQNGFRETEYEEITLYKVLVDFRKEFQWDMSILKMHRCFEITFSRSRLSDSEKNYKFLLTQYLEEHYGKDFNIGIGFGNSIDIGRYYAIKSLDASKNYGTNTCFISNSGNDLIGPIGTSQCLSYKFPTVDLENAAKEMKITPYNLTRIIALWDSGEHMLNSEIVSYYLNITMRSANRILSMLYKHGFLELTGNKTLNYRDKGRPSKFYKMNRSDINVKMKL